MVEYKLQKEGKSTHTLLGQMDKQNIYTSLFIYNYFTYESNHDLIMLVNALFCSKEEKVLRWFRKVFNSWTRG